jgi:hypothetical protein
VDQLRARTGERKVEDVFLAVLAKSDAEWGTTVR